jgi:hypothetical protein
MVDLKPKAPLLIYAFSVTQRLHITHLTMILMIEHNYQWDYSPMTGSLLIAKKVPCDRDITVYVVHPNKAVPPG